jgi:hypothetical protein
MDGADVHPIRGTAGTARGGGTDRSNEWLDANTEKPVALAITVGKRFGC